jgi:ABC-2 type transport system ATP-binding protein
MGEGDMDHAIEVSELRKTFPGEVVALDGVSFTVAPGEVFAYLGRNGQGKTTTVRILSTLTSATSGRAIVAGHDVSRDRSAVLRAIGVTMQSAALDPEMTGREHLEFVAALWGEVGSPRATAERLLATFSLLDAADRQVRTYSGGMRRRLDLAGALVNQPKVLFLDEPTTGLDAQSRRTLWETVRALRADGTAIFLTTQYLEEAEALADRVAVIEAGRLIALGTSDGLKASTGSASLEDAFIRLTGSEPELVPVATEGA